jgi:hypothetical protein
VLDGTIRFNSFLGYLVSSGRQVLPKVSYFGRFCHRTEGEGGAVGATGMRWSVAWRLLPQWPRRRRRSPCRKPRTNGIGGGVASDGDE